MIAEKCQGTTERQSTRLSDQELICAAQKGDAKSFENLVLRHHANLLGFVCSQMGGSDTSQDITNQAFTKAWKRLEKYTPTANFTTWVTRIALNLIYDHYRSEKAREKRTKEHPLFILENAHSRAPSPPDDLIMQIEDQSLRQQKLKMAINNLPDRSRKLVALRLEGLSYEDIANKSEIPIGTVMSGLSRSLKILKANLSLT